MASRDEEQAPPHHHRPILSSLVVRPEVNNVADTSADGGNDLQPGEFPRDHRSPYSRSDRYSALAMKHTGEIVAKGVKEVVDGSVLPNFGILRAAVVVSLWHTFRSCAPEYDYFLKGYSIRAGSASPVHHRDANYRLGSDYNHLSRSRGYGGERGPGRYRDPSPRHVRGRVGGRPTGRSFDRPDFVPGPSRGETNSRNNPNLRPRKGDWICTGLRCGNLNFAKRVYCNKCNWSRAAAAGSPRRAYPGPPPLRTPPRRIPGSPERTVVGYISPPRGLAREYGSAALPPFRHEGRFVDPHVHRDRVDYLEDPYRGRNKFDRPPPPLDRDRRKRGRDTFYNERKGFERRPLLPPLLPHHGGRRAQDERERSRSPLRGGPPPKKYRRVTFVNPGRDDRRASGRDRNRGMH